MTEPASRESACGWCGGPVTQTGRGRWREYCSDSHRVSASRDRGAQVFLYRAYDEDGQLLYIGRSKRLPERLGTHSAEQPWWHRVRRIDVEPIAADRHPAQVEDDAIRTEHPLHNAYAAVRRPEGVPVAMCSLQRYCGAAATTSRVIFTHANGSERVLRLCDDHARAHAERHSTSPSPSTSR